MRHTGILRTWHDDRGFGFIAPTQGGRELFVHISAFGAAGGRPVLGERLSYTLGQGTDGRPQALDVRREALAGGAAAADSAVNRPRPGAYQPPMPRRSASGGGRWLSVKVVLGVVVVLAVVFRQHFLAALRGGPPAAEPALSLPGWRPAPPAEASSYRCDGRTHCSQMTSCAEATWFLQHCPGVQMDGNHDGVPCEQQWCR